jgi:hypothetical protein
VVAADAVLDVVPIFLRVPRAEVAYVKFIVESYEGVAVTRTLDRHAALVALLVAPDFLAEAYAIVAWFEQEIGAQVVAPPPGPIDLLAVDDTP